MKIVFVAVFTPNSTNVSQSRGFKDNGYDVLEYDYRSKLSRLGSVVKRDDDLIKTVENFNPDITIFSKCNNMHYRVIVGCNKYSKTILWYMDAINNFNGELIDKIKRVDYFVNGIEGVVPHGKKYNKNTIFLPQCPDEKMNFPLDDLDYKYNVTFIGNIQPNSTHADRLRYKNKINFTHFNNKYGLEHNKIVNQSKINLNFSHTSTNGASVRVFKILAAKGFLLTTPWKGMEKLFNIGEHLDVFTSPADLQKKINYYLYHEEERNKIRVQGNKIVQKYLPINWAKKMVSIIENIN